MPATFTTTDGLTLAYYVWGESAEPPVLLHHGFAASAAHNWELPGIVDALVAAGRRVVALDARGHGASEKPHDPAYYGESRMAEDVATLADHLALGAFDLVGYSMGAIVALLVAVGESRVRRLVVGGVGEGIVRFGGVERRGVGPAAISAALRAEDPATITDPRAAAFRRFAEATGADRLALAAQTDRVHSDPIDLAAITAPTLVLTGESDDLAVAPQTLAAAIPRAELRLVPGDHLGAVRAPEFTAALVGFLADPR